MLLTLKKSKDRLLVIGPNANKTIINKVIDNYDKIIINGSFDMNDIECLKNEKIIYNLSKKDFNNIDKYEFLRSCPNVIIIERLSQVHFIIVAGCINVSNKNDLEDNIEQSFLNNEIYHKKYLGKFGYMISNNPYGEEPKLYDFSVSIGNHNKVYGIELSQFGISSMFALDNA